VFNDLRRSIAALVKGVLVVLGGASADSGFAAKADGSALIEIEPGDGPDWGTLSSLTAHRSDPRRLFAVTDQDSPPLRIVEIQVSETSARVVRQINVSTADFDDLDVEGLVMKPDGGFWLASEGQAGNTPPNVLLDIDAEGRLLRSINVPEAVAGKIQRQGFEGVALVPSSAGDKLVVSFQSGFKGDADDVSRIGVVDLASGAWTFYLYPLERLDDGDVSGLSDILHLGDRRFALLERDGKGGRRAIKWITTIDLGATTGADIKDAPATLGKRRVFDFVPMFLDLDRKVEKEIEGLTIAADGQVYAVTDNDNKRATVLLKLGKRDDIFGR
jgi:hypothetical protein